MEVRLACYKLRKEFVSTSELNQPNSFSISAKWLLNTCLSKGFFTFRHGTSFFARKFWDRVNLITFFKVCLNVLTLCARNERFRESRKINSLYHCSQTRLSCPLVRISSEPECLIQIIIAATFIWYLIRNLISLENQDVICSHLVSVVSLHDTTSD